MGIPGKATKTKLQYKDYINSPEWRRKREQYWQSKLSSNCYCCDTPRHKGMHLHHRTYKNLGNERLMDLVPVCQACHSEIHKLHRGDVRWQGKGLWATTQHVRKQSRRDRTGR